MKTAVILGAKSDIAKAIAIELASRKVNLVLAARHLMQLEPFKESLQSEYSIKVTLEELDALAYDTHGKFCQNLPHDTDTVFCVFGYLGDQKKAETEPDEMFQIIETNFVGAVSLLEIMASKFEKNKHGVIVGISSVAGERGRQSNYFYGSSKAAFSAYLSGLRNRLYKSKVQVITVKPGYVKTRMTEQLQLPPLISTSAEVVAKSILKAIDNNKSEIYVPGIWRGIMCFVKLIPEFVFKRMNL